MFLFGCNMVTENTNEQSKNYNEYNSKYMSEGFKEILEDNPIDKQYENREYTGNYKEYYKVVEAYTECWKNDMLKI